MAFANDTLDYARICLLTNALKYNCHTAMQYYEIKHMHPFLYCIFDHFQIQPTTFHSYYCYNLGTNLVHASFLVEGNEQIVRKTIKLRDGFVHNVTV